jgi:hypothetical protein
MRNARSFCILHLAFSAFVIWHSTLLAAVGAARRVTWADLPASIQARLESAGLTARGFPARIATIDRDAQRRVREGDFDHLIFYVLQSTHFTRLPPIEPALSARRLPREFIVRREADAPPGTLPPDVDARIAAFLKAIDSRDSDPRLSYFRVLIAGAASGDDRRKVIAMHYFRAMAFLFQKEFAAPQPEAVARLYESRGLSTDTAVEAGFAVHAGLGVLKGLDPSRRIRRVLIVGPGIDLAPRTGMLEAGPPESYQPWAVIDALVSLDLSRLSELEVVGADINPRVVDHLRASAQKAPVLRMVSGIAESDALAFTPGYREYFAALGTAVGQVRGGAGAPGGHLSKTVAVSGRAAATLRAEPLNVVTERLADQTFDLVIATNILPYFNPVERLLAFSNIRSMLAPDGVLLHNDARPEVLQDALTAGLAGEQSRQMIIATVKGAPPLADTIVLHRRR